MHRLLLLAVAFATVRALALAPHEVPRPPPGVWVQDLTGTLRRSTVAEASAIAEGVHREAVGQIGVAVVRNTGGQNPRRYATALFNAWGVGQRGRDDGVLLFIALQDRAAEIVLGNGVDSDASIAVTDRIMADVVVARMKRGDPDAAVVEATRALAAHLRSRPTGHTGTRRAGPFPLDKLLWPLGLVVVGLTGGGLGLTRYLRRRPRRCLHCDTPRVLLDEETDDTYLDAGQQVEERVKAVDYDVWWCEPCGDPLVLRHGRWFSGRKSCVKCSYKTASSATLTLRAATEYSRGLVQVTQTCAHCRHEHVYTRTTARITRGSSSGSSSFGGGSSSGGGSSGRW